MEVGRGDLKNQLSESVNIECSLAKVCVQAEWPLWKDMFILRSFNLGIFQHAFSFPPKVHFCNTRN